MQECSRTPLHTPQTMNYRLTHTDTHTYQDACLTLWAFSSSDKRLVNSFFLCTFCTNNFSHNCLMAVLCKNNQITPLSLAAPTYLCKSYAKLTFQRFPARAMHVCDMVAVMQSIDCGVILLTDFHGGIGVSPVICGGNCREVCFLGSFRTRHCQFFLSHSSF